MPSTIPIAQIGHHSVHWPTARLVPDEGNPVHMVWYLLRDSNPRPSPCKGEALASELKQAWSRKGVDSELMVPLPTWSE